jgi:hypothetical protein
MMATANRNCQYQICKLEPEGISSVENPWITLILLALAAGFLPWQFSAEVLILGKEHGLRRATAFTGGITLWRFLIGFVLAFVLAGGLAILNNGFGTILDFISAGFQSGVGRVENRPGRVLDILLILCGIFLVMRMIRNWNGGADPDAPPPKILGTLDSIGPRAAFGFGIVWMAVSVAQWTFLTAGVEQILDFDGGLALKVAAFLLFLAVASLFILSPIVLYAVQPSKAQARLAVMEEKMDVGMRYLGFFFQGGIGIFLIWRGLLHLSGG